MRRFVVIGMCNPQGNEPFWPDPPGCAGDRLWQMATARTGISKEDWLAITDRRNLCSGTNWDLSLAKAQARRWTVELADKVTVLMGADVARCFPSTGMMGHWARAMGTPPRAVNPWIMMPHPSGQNLWYNDPFNKAWAEILLADIIEECR